MLTTPNYTALLNEAILMLKSTKRIRYDAEIARDLDYSKGVVSNYISGKIPPSLKFMQTFFEYYKIPAEMQQSFISEIEPTAQPSNLIHAPHGKFPKKIGIGLQPVPFYDVDFAAGDIEMFDDANAIQPAYMMDIPEFSGCTAFRVFSNSMESLINSGSILFGTKVTRWNDHLEYGQVYGIVCQDKRRYLKYIRKAAGKDESHFLLRSENVEEFDDFLMPKNQIKSIWLIHGWMQRRT